MILVLKFSKIFFYQVLNLYLVAMYVSYLPKSKQKYFKILHIFKKIFSKLFWPRSIDRVVDRAYYRPERSIAQSIGVLAITDVHVVHIPDRPVPSCGRPSGRPTVSSQLSVCLGRPTGRPGRANGQIFESTGRPTDRLQVY